MNELTFSILQIGFNIIACLEIVQNQTHLSFVLNAITWHVFKSINVQTPAPFVCMLVLM